MVTCLLLVLLSQDAGTAGTAGAGTVALTVKVENITEVKGKLFVSIYAKADGFPGKSELALKRDAVPVTGTSQVYTFEGLAPGTYAVGVAHDVNDNGKVDTNFIGIPKEPVGVSNDAKGRFGPPKFEDAKFSLAGDKTITVHLQ
jgi:uncharacterized protein (DUF2141 family)